MFGVDVPSVVVVVVVTYVVVVVLSERVKERESGENGV